jgi:hypothetical protein
MVLAAVNPNDIESFEIRKMNATAIPGSRTANLKFLITTKK